MHRRGVESRRRTVCVQERERGEGDEWRKRKRVRKKQSCKVQELRK